MKRKMGTVDLKEWTLDTTERLQEALTERLQETLSKALHEAAAEALQLALDDDETYLIFPAVWGDRDGIGGPPVDDPLTIYMRLALGSSDAEGPIWATSLRDALEDDMAICSEDGSFAPGLSRIRDALRALADDIDNVLPKSGAI